MVLALRTTAELQSMKKENKNNASPQESTENRAHVAEKHTPASPGVPSTERDTRDSTDSTPTDTPIPPDKASVDAEQIGQAGTQPEPGGTAPDKTNASKTTGQPTECASDSPLSDTESPCSSCPKTELLEWARKKVLGWPGKDEGKPCPWELMNGKPVLYAKAKSVLNLKSDEFHEKLLCDGITMNLGYACGFSCWYCYVETAVYRNVEVLIRRFNRRWKTNFGFQDLVIRRQDTIKVLKRQLLNSNGTRRFTDANDRRVVYTSTLVDAAANLELLKETAEAIIVIFENTDWDVRVLSKSAALKRLISDGLIPKKYHHRLILGFSIGTLDDNIAKAIEHGTSSPTARIQALHWLQDQGIRTFGMICPSLPQEDYDKFSNEMCAAIRIEKCEHVWAEPINGRGDSMRKTIDALKLAGFEVEAKLLESVVIDKNHEANWEAYARATFEAHCKHIPKNKLRFLQYVDAKTAQWWADRRADGAIPLGQEAQGRMLLACGQSAQTEPLRNLTDEDRKLREELESDVHEGVRASMRAAQALHKLKFHDGGILWRLDYLTFEAYCSAKWGYAHAYAYKLLNAGRLCDDIVLLQNQENCGKDDDTSAMQTRLPKSEGQIRGFLEIVPKEHQAACWCNIDKNHDTAKLTSAMVNDLAMEYMRDHKIPVKKFINPKSEQEKIELNRTRALDTVDRLEDLVERLPQPERFDDVIATLRKEIGPNPLTDVIEVTATVVGGEGQLLSDSEKTPITPGSGNTGGETTSKRRPKSKNSDNTAKTGDQNAD